MTSETAEAAFPIDIKVAENEIFSLVKNGDLSSLTNAMIRQNLKEKFNVDFDAVRKQINEMTRVAIEKLNSEKEEAQPGPATAGKKDDSSSDSDDMLIDDRKPIRKRKTEDPNGERRPGRKAAAKAKQDIRKSSGVYIARGRKDIGPAEKKAKKEGGPRFGRKTKLVWISPELQEVVGEPYSKRCDVVSKMWAYVREHDLFLPTDKRFAVCDDLLLKIFKKKKFRVFSMSKDLTKHIRNPEDMGAEYVEESEEYKNKVIAEYNENKFREENGGGVKKEEPEDDDEGGSDDDDDSDDGDQAESTNVTVKEEIKQEDDEYVDGNTEVKSEIKEEVCQ